MGRGGRGGGAGRSIVVRHGTACASVGTVLEAADLMVALQEATAKVGPTGKAEVASSHSGSLLEADAPRQALALEAQRLLSAAAELVATLGEATVAKGLRGLRDRGLRPPPEQERRWRALDSATAFLRHPG